MPNMIDPADTFATAMASASGRNTPTDAELKIALTRSLGEQSSAEFFARFANLVQHFDEKLRQSLHSYTRLHGLKLIQENTSNLEEGPTMPELLKILAISFFDLLDRKAIEPIVPLNLVAQAELSELKILAGRTPQPRAPEPIEVTIERQVLADWGSLAGAEIKAIMKVTPAYRAAVERLAAEGRLP